MNPKRLILAIVVVFVGVFTTDFLIHGIWLQGAYKGTANLWRTEPEMQAHMGWLMLAQFLAAATFVVLWAKGIRRHSLHPVCLALWSVHEPVQPSDDSHDLRRATVAGEYRCEMVRGWRRAGSAHGRARLFRLPTEAGGRETQVVTTQSLTADERGWTPITGLDNG